MTVQITELLGDGIGDELRDALYTVADVLPVDFNFIPFDLSLRNRENSPRSLFDKVSDSMHETKLAIKYPTVTAGESPNAIIRRMCNFSVILRPVISIRGIKTHFTEPVFLHIVRIATGGTYDDPGQMVGKDTAVSIRIVERTPCLNAAHYAFRFARKKNLTVTSSSKHTIQRVTDGLFESIVKEVHKYYEDIPHQTELFDALLAKIILNPEDYQVVLVLNEYGDFLSDMASGLIGSIGMGASGNFSFSDESTIDIAMFDPSGGTAPDIAGENLCNPTGILLSFGMLLDHIGHYDYGHQLRLAMLALIGEGHCTKDIGGELGTSDFVNMVCDRLKAELDNSNTHA